MRFVHNSSHLNIHRYLLYERTEIAKRFAFQMRTLKNTKIHVLRIVAFQQKNH